MDGIQLSFFDAEISDEDKRLREILKRGSGFEGGCLRIYAAERLLDADRFVMFLADEFNVGGHSVTLEGFRGVCDYNGARDGHPGVENGPGMEIRMEKNRAGLPGYDQHGRVPGVQRDHAV